jgi:large subunit ribosomal protein L13
MAKEAAKQNIEMREHTIDASGKRLGRVATEAAHVLLGKDRPDVEKHVVAPVVVKVVNASKLDISEKRAGEEFQTYSGYPGGRRVETLGHLGTRRGYGEVVRRVVGGMLPKNKLHKIRMKNLEVTE